MADGEFVGIAQVDERDGDFAVFDGVVGVSGLEIADASVTRAVSAGDSVSGDGSVAGWDGDAARRTARK